MRMAWYVPGTQPGCKPCSVIFKMSLVVIVWPLGSKTRQTSKIRRDSENWVILGHTPKLPKIIDRRNVQECYFIIFNHFSMISNILRMYRSCSPSFQFFFSLLSMCMPDLQWRTLAKKDTRLNLNGWICVGRWWEMQVPLLWILSDDQLATDVQGCICCL